MLANIPKQVRVFLVGVIIIICGGICLADGIKTYDRLVTTKGMDFGKVTVLRVDKDTILIRHSGGTGPLKIDSLPDAIRKDLGLPTRAEIALQKEEMKKKEDEQHRLNLIKAKEALEAHARYDEEQKAKGLVKFQGQWNTPEEVKQIEAKSENTPFGNLAGNGSLSDELWGKNAEESTPCTPEEQASNRLLLQKMMAADEAAHEPIIEIIGLLANEESRDIPYSKAIEIETGGAKPF